MPGGDIKEVFRDNLLQLSNQASLQADAVRGKGGTRPWNRPDDVADPLDIEGITDGYDRSEIDTSYADLIKDAADPGTAGDVISLKTQGDYIAIMERGFRARHATPVRCIGHAMARRNGHGQSTGVFLGGVLQHVQDAWQAGQDG